MLSHVCDAMPWNSASQRNVCCDVMHGVMANHYPLARRRGGGEGGGGEGRGEEIHCLRKT